MHTIQKNFCHASLAALVPLSIHVLSLPALAHHGSFYKAIFAAIEKEDVESIRSLFSDSAWKGESGKFLCREFIYEHPSKSFDVTDYGAYFPDFLISRNEVRDFPFLPDIARLEWAAERAFYSPRFGSLIQTQYEVSRSYLAFLEGGTEALEENPFKKGEERIVVSARQGYARITLVNNIEDGGGGYDET